MDPVNNPCSDPRAALRTVALAGIDALFGALGSAPAAAPAGPSVTLRYGTISVTVPEAQIGAKDIGELFAERANDLGGLTLGDNVTLRDTHASEGGVVDESDAPILGRTYVASIRKEDKGSK